MVVGVPDYLVVTLQLIQNQAAQQIRSDHITETLIIVHWLPVKFHIEYEMLLFASKSQHDTAPVYLTDLLSPYVSPRTPRSEQQLRLEQPRASQRSMESVLSLLRPRACGMTHLLK